MGKCTDGSISQSSFCYPYALLVPNNTKTKTKTDKLTIVVLPRVFTVRSWQAFTALAYGARGLLYFCYWNPAGDEFTRGGAIIAPVGTSTDASDYVAGPHYAHAAATNSVVLAWERSLTGAVSLGVWRAVSRKINTQPLLTNLIQDGLTLAL